MTTWTDVDLAKCCLCGTVRHISSMLPAGNGLYQCKGIVMCLNRVRRSRGQLVIHMNLTTVINPGAVTFTSGGAGALTAVARAKFAKTAALTGHGALTVTTRAKFARTAALTGHGALTRQSPALPTFGSVGVPATGSNSTMALIPVPPGVVAGSAVVVLLYIETNQSATPPAGFTEAPSSPATATGAQAHSLRIYEHVATGAESGNYTFTIASGLFWRDGQAMRIDNASQIGGSIFDVCNSAAKSTTTDGNFPAVSVTTTGANRLLLWFSGNFAGGSDTTPPTGFTERVQQLGHEMATKLQTSAGASGSLTGTVNVNSATTAWVGAVR